MSAPVPTLAERIEQLGALRSLALRHPDASTSLLELINREQAELDALDMDLVAIARAVVGNRTDVVWGYQDDWNCDDYGAVEWLSLGEYRLLLGKNYSGRAYILRHFDNTPAYDSDMPTTVEAAYNLIVSWLRAADEFARSFD